MGKPEARIENALVKRITAIGGEVRKAQWIGRRGCPDRFVMLPAGCYTRLNGPLERMHEGGSCWVELKAPGGVLEDHQLREHARMMRYGLHVIVIDSLCAIDGYFPLELP